MEEKNRTVFIQNLLKLVAPGTPLRLVLIMYYERIQVD